MTAEDNEKEKALGHTYQRLRASLMRYASRYFRKPHEIEDVVQEAFVKVLQAQSIRHIHSIEAYLFRTARNIALNSLERNDYKLTERLDDIVAEANIPVSPTLESEYESRQRFELFCDSVADLPNKCRQAFVLRRVYGFSQAEIAEKMGVSVHTVETHLAKGVVRCERFMRKRGADEEQATFKRNKRHIS